MWRLARTETGLRSATSSLGLYVCINLLFIADSQVKSWQDVASKRSKNRRVIGGRGAHRWLAKSIALGFFEIVFPYDWIL